MAFFQDLGKKITDVVQDASKKTTELIEVSRLNSAISAEKNAIEETQKNIGVKAYALYTSGETLPDALMSDLQSISSRMQTIVNLENKIAEAKAEAESAKNEPGAAGANAESQEPSAAESDKVCIACGAPLEPGMSFCGKCGQKQN